MYFHACFFLFLTHWSLGLSNEISEVIFRLALVFDGRGISFVKLLSDESHQDLTDD